MTTRSHLVGIFVGGSSSRMGGAPKGLLPPPDGSPSLVERLVRTARSALAQTEIVLVGTQPAYTRFGMRMLSDRPEGIGPLGGLRSLLEEALRAGSEAVALACDLPYVTSGLIERVARHEPKLDAVAPRVQGRWQPLCARYRPATCLPIIDGLLEKKLYGLHRLLDALGDRAAALPVNDAEIEALGDWDTPDAIRRRTPPGQ